MLATILGLINPLSHITQQIADVKLAAIEADTAEGKLRSDETVKALEARRDVLVAESRTPINSIVRALLAAPAGIFIWVVIVRDKVLGWGTTDDLSQNLWAYVFMVLGFYFVDQIVKRAKQ